MAFNVYKQACPSCEDMVLIKDQSQIGKKIDCPKCKYRFMVEKPYSPDEEEVEVEVMEDEEVAPAKSAAKKGPAAKTDPAVKAPAGKAPPGKVPAKAAAKATDTKGPPAKGPDGKPLPAVKKKPARKQMDDDDDDDDDDRPKKKKKKGNSGNLVVIAGVGIAVVALVLLAVGGYFIFFNSEEKVGPIVKNTAGTRPASTSTEPEDDPKPTGPQLAEVTNLLPNDTEAVAHVHFQQGLKSIVGSAAFDTAGAFQRKVVENKLGLNVENVERVVLGFNFRKGTAFAVVRTVKPITLKKLTTVLELEPGPDSPYKTYDYFVTKPSVWLGNLVRLVTPVAVNAVGQPMPRPTEPPKPTSLAVYVFKDLQTIVVTGVEPLKEFFDIKCEPAVKFKGGETKAKGSQSIPVTKRYLTINPAMKAVLDAVESRPPIVISLAVGTEALQQQIKQLGIKANSAVELSAENLINSSEALGTAWQIRESSTFFIASHASSTDTPKKFQQELKTFGPIIAEMGFMTEVDGQSFKPPVPPRLPGVPLPPPGPPPTKIVMRTNLQDRTLLISGEIQMTDMTEKVRKEILQPGMMLLRAMTDMASPKPRIFDLAAAVQAYTKKTGSFPRGTATRPPTNYGRPWPPDQRVSWMAQLLPYLGQPDVLRDINPDVSWRPEKYADSKGNAIEGNPRMGAVMVPEFLDPTSPPNTWFVTLPSMPGRAFGATHYVGIGGIGLEAAEYDPAAEPALAKKIGIMGYDREAKVDDVKDGLASTILLIQVPPTFKRPWIAGGGSTIAGVPETKCVAPFVCATYDGKRGTFAIMADGSVRFIPATITDDAFKALCTMSAGDKVDLDKETTLIPPPKVEPVAEK